MKIELDDLETLEAIVETGTFAGAAKRLHKAQSAVSYAIRDLEGQLGVELFDRSGHRAELTDVGRMVLQEGRYLLAAARRLETVVSRLAHEWEPRLDVIIDGIVPMEPVMRVLKTMADEQVPTLIQVKMEFLGGVHYRFDRDNADCMLVKDFDADEFLAAEPLAPVEAVLVAESTHPLCTRDDARPVELEELKRYVELTIQDSSPSPGPDPRTFGGTRVFFLSDFHTKRQALLRGLGFGWMPLHLVDEDLAADRLREIDFAGGSRYQFTPHLVWRTDRPMGRAGQMFASRIQEEFGAAR